MSAHLLDANALIALVVSDHEHHGRVTSWLGEHRRFALCPIVEGSLFRFLIRVGENPGTATALLRAVHNSSRCNFWPDDLSYAEARMDHIVGHRQVTDAYLVALARQRRCTLATFDQGLVAQHPDGAMLIP